MYYVCVWLQEGYGHQQFDEASSFLTTFNTELGRFRYTVMPFGMTVTGYVFQYNLDQCLGHIRQVLVIADDIMIVGKKANHIDHDKVLTTFLEAVIRCNVWLNYEKLQYKEEEIDIFGETYTTSSHKHDKNNVTAITKMPAPTNKKQAQSFIRMIIYLSKFSARLSEIAEPIINWCKHKKCKHMFTSRMKTSLLWQQSFNRCTMEICSYWIRITCRCLGYEEIPSFLVCKPFHSGNGSEALRSNFIQKH